MSWVMDFCMDSIMSGVVSRRHRWSLYSSACMDFGMVWWTDKQGPSVTFNATPHCFSPSWPSSVPWRKCPQSRSMSFTMLSIKPLTSKSEWSCHRWPSSYRRTHQAAISWQYMPSMAQWSCHRWPSSHGRKASSCTLVAIHAMHGVEQTACEARSALAMKAIVTAIVPNERCEEHKLKYCEPAQIVSNCTCWMLSTDLSMDQKQKQSKQTYHFYSVLGSFAFQSHEDTRNCSRLVNECIKRRVPALKFHQRSTFQPQQFKYTRLELELPCHAFLQLAVVKCLLILITKHGCPVLLFVVATCLRRKIGEWVRP